MSAPMAGSVMRKSKSERPNEMLKSRTREELRVISAFALTLLAVDDGVGEDGTHPYGGLCWVTLNRDD